MPRSQSASSSPIVSVSVVPSVSNRLVEMSVQSGPWLRPSNVTVPIITHTKATVPGGRSSGGRPLNSGRTPTSWPSPISTTTGRSGAASLAPTPAGKP